MTNDLFVDTRKETRRKESRNEKKGESKRYERRVETRRKESRNEKKGESKREERGVEASIFQDEEKGFLTREDLSIMRCNCAFLCYDSISSLSMLNLIPWWNQVTDHVAKYQVENCSRKGISENDEKVLSFQSDT